LKIIKLYNEKLLIQKAIHNSREAQQRLFTKHSPKILRVCRQYVKDLQHVEDFLLTGFLKVFIKSSSDSVTMFFLRRREMQVFTMILRIQPIKRPLCLN
jgi:hypothetical protein